ncbi:MAG: TraB/GumN family protein [Glycocaulis sp.]
MLRCLLAVLACALTLSPALAVQDTPAPEAAETEIITVRAERSGPQLWRISHPEQAGEVYVFITIPWLPASLEWNERPVASVLEEAGEVLTEFEVNAGAVSTTRMAAMMLRTVTFNRSRLMMPRGITLADRVGEELAAEFYEAAAIAEERNERRRAIRRAARRGDGELTADDVLEEPEQSALAARLASLEPGRMHPFFQAMNLIGKAAQSVDLQGSSAIESRVTRLARRNRVPVRAVQSYDLAVSDISALMRSVQDFSRETNETCISEAVTFARSELPTAWMAAQAWARGDVDTLRGFSGRRTGLDCQRAMEGEMGGLRTFGGATTADIDYPGIWAQAIGSSIAGGGVTLAIVGAAGWLAEDGIQARLAAAGYVVEGP